MIVYHGTKNVKTFDISKGYQSTGEKGRFAAGSGLYTTVSEDVAGSFGETIALEIELDQNHEDRSINMKIEDIREFIKNKLSKTWLRRFNHQLEDFFVRRDKDPEQEKEINAYNFMTLMMLANEKKYHLISQEMNDYFVKNNVKFGIDHYSGHKTILVYDFEIIKRQLELKDVNKEDTVFRYDILTKKQEEKDEKRRSFKMN